MLKNFWKDETGAELAEYAVAVALLVAIGVLAYNAIGNAILDKNDGTSTAIDGAAFTDANP